MNSKYWEKYKSQSEYYGFNFQDLVEIAKIMKKLEIDNVVYLRLMLEKNEMFFTHFLSGNIEEN